MGRMYRMFHPEVFQGVDKTSSNYFEGWYFKLIDRRQEAPLAVIPGVSFQKDGRDNHAFVQVMDGASHKAHYFRYPIQAFHAEPKAFEVAIGNNRFNSSGLDLDLGEGAEAIRGTLRFEGIVPFRGHCPWPGIMGPYTFVPGMECNHGVVNIHHEIHGTLDIMGRTADYEGGYGYIEKDWGRSFPKSWIWLQSNHFVQEDISFMFSYADIPWMGKSFMGLISFVRVGEKLLILGTYTGARVSALSYDGRTLSARVEDRKHVLEFQADHGPGSILRAPKNGLMAAEILESIAGVVRVRLSSRSGRRIFEGTGTQTGMEISEGMEKILFTSPQSDGIL